MQENKIKYIIAGLGNPGLKYMDTRHNAGFRALDYISQKYNFKINNLKYRAYCGRYHFENNGDPDAPESFDVLFMKPQTYMNDSGESVGAAARFYKIAPENILVISDDVSLPVGRIRVRAKGSDGGQKGLRSIINNLGTEDFPRIKIGAGEKPHPDVKLEKWVLSDFTKQEQKIIFDIFGGVYDCVDMFLRGFTIDRIQNKYN
jgi:PTH1 family peptidyl-tRNA hydrolase